MKWAIADGFELDDVLATLSEGRVVYALTAEDDQYRLEQATGWDPDRHTLGAYRQVEPVKSLLFRPRESLGPWQEPTAGGDPRPERARRLRHRFDKKFVFFPETLGRYACDGCGRCSEACIGRIDIRTVLKRAVDEAGAV